MHIREVKKKKLFCFLVLVIFFLIIGSKSSFSQCSCQCISGRVQPVCSEVNEMVPICPPKVCMAARLKVPTPKNFAPPRLKIMPSNCQQRIVKNPNTNQFIWRTVCRPENSFQ